MKINIHKAKYKGDEWYHYIFPKRLTLLCNPPIFKWLCFVYSYTKEEWEEKLHKKGQNTFIYCPWCGVELISTGSFVKDTDLIYYKCKCCDLETAWLFDAPAPILIKKGSSDYENTK